MEKLNRLISACKASVSVDVNTHRDYNESVENYFESSPVLFEDVEDIDPEVYDKMKELNTVVELQFYPDTSVGFYKIYHYDVEMALDEALNALNIRQ